MSKNIASLGARENAFLMDMAGRGKTIFSLSNATSFWGSPHYARIAIHRLVNKGWLIQLERGKYLLVPLEAGRTRQWTEDPFVIAAALVQPGAIAYWSAIRHWNWTEQLPRVIYVQTTRRKYRPAQTILGVNYEIVTVSKLKFFGYTTEWRNGKAIKVTDREKTLIDCADDVERAGTVEELSKAVAAAATEISWQRLNQYAQRFPNGAVKKRLGYLFETLVPSLPRNATGVLESWRQHLKAGVVPLQPGYSKKGRISSRWRIMINARVS
jgi:predicted transcriptional regulator of viral defense system